MKLIAHRRNTISELRQTPTGYGVEVDIRSHGEELILHHDPFQDGERFSDWLTAYHHGTIILNVKEEGLEDAVLRTLHDHQVSDFFFLDQSFPFLLRTARRGERRCAVRVSEFEGLAAAMSLAGRVDWVWLDCFDGFPLRRDEWFGLVEAGLRICLVSPELLGRSPEAEILDLLQQFAAWGTHPHAVCAKLEVLPLWLGPA